MAWMFEYLKCGKQYSLFDAKFDEICVCVSYAICTRTFDWTLASEDEYLQACVAGFSQDYGPMVALLGRCAA
jgi:hypothetical protein